MVYAYLEEGPYSVVEGASFEVCVRTENRGPGVVQFTVWLHIKGLYILP